MYMTNQCKNATNTAPEHNPFFMQLAITGEIMNLQARYELPRKLISVHGFLFDWRNLQEHLGWARPTMACCDSTDGAKTFYLISHPGSEKLSESTCTAFRQSALKLPSYVFPVTQLWTHTRIVILSKGCVPVLCPKL